MLFVGEAPGESENVLGLPFVGPAGKLMDLIIGRAFDGVFLSTSNGYDGRPIRYALTNLVGCIPRDEGGGKATEPDDDQIKACSARLVEFVALASPRLIVCVGSLARDFLSPGYKHSVPIPKGIPRIDVTHPAAMLRANVAAKGLMVQKAVVTIRCAAEDL